ncbi:hypothetical protein JCM30394_04640 [Deferrisoma palaeochoriense]
MSEIEHHGTEAGAAQRHGILSAEFRFLFSGTAAPGSPGGPLPPNAGDGSVPVGSSRKPRGAWPVCKNNNFRLGHAVSRGRLDHRTDDRETGDRGPKLLGNFPAPLWGPATQDSNARVRGPVWERLPCQESVDRQKRIRGSPTSDV